MLLSGHKKALGGWKECSVEHRYLPWRPLALTGEISASSPFMGTRYQEIDYLWRYKFGVSTRSLWNPRLRQKLNKWKWITKLKWEIQQNWLGAYFIYEWGCLKFWPVVGLRAQPGGTGESVHLWEAGGHGCRGSGEQTGKILWNAHEETSKDCDENNALLL